MKAIIMIILSILIVSCGSRQKAKEQDKYQTFSDTSVEKSSKADLKIERSESDLQVTDLSKTNISVSPKCKSVPGSPSAPGTAAPRTMTIKDGKGNEAMIPVDENSEIRIENTAELSSKLKITELQLKASEKENTELKVKNKELLEQNRLSVKSERPVWWLYIFLFFAGMIFLPTIKFFIKR